MRIFLTAVSLAFLLSVGAGVKSARSENATFKRDQFRSLYHSCQTFLAEPSWLAMAEFQKALDIRR